MSLRQLGLYFIAYEPDEFIHSHCTLIFTSLTPYRQGIVFNFLFTDDHEERYPLQLILTYPFTYCLVPVVQCGANIGIIQ